MHLHFLWRVQAGFPPFLRLKHLKAMLPGTLNIDVIFALYFLLISYLQRCLYKWNL